jgi:hypothetical protein
MATPSAVRSRTILNNCSLSAFDSAAVGSSIAIIEALRARALPIMTSHRSATDNCDTSVSRGNLIPTRSAASRAPTLERRQSMRPQRVALGAPSSMFCSTLKWGTRFSS